MKEEFNNMLIWDIPFIVVDVETTGADPKNNRVTDVACVTTVGGEIISKYDSLVNPHQSIPPFITKMTGITYDMVINAPEPNEVFLKILKIFIEPRTVFVAHNARFDFGFINETLNRSGLPSINPPLLCTLKLARRLLPKKNKKNLGAVADFFNITIKNRHRALGDALATAHTLTRLLELAEKHHSINTLEELLVFQNKQLKYFHAPSTTLKRMEKQLTEIPEQSGVYKFYDKKMNLLYIGKAKNLKKRVRSYFYQDTFASRKIANMLKRVHNADWECTETELAALLLESKEIKKSKPPFNTVDKKYKKYPFIKLNIQNDYPYIMTSNTIEPDNADYYGPLRSQALADDIVRTVEKKFNIRKCTKTINGNSKPCFYYHLEQCFSPCSGNINRQRYLSEIRKISYFLSGFADGIIEEIESKMMYWSEKLEFEKAEKLKRNIVDLKRALSKNNKIPSSVHKNNVIIIIPGSHREKTIEVFMIKSGKLLFQTVIGRKSSLISILNQIHNIYFNSINANNSFSKEDIDELRIINSWIIRQNGNGESIYTAEKSKKELEKEFELAVRNTSFADD